MGLRAASLVDLQAASQAGPLEASPVDLRAASQAGLREASRADPAVSPAADRAVVREEHPLPRPRRSFPRNSSSSPRCMPWTPVTSVGACTAMCTYGSATETSTGFI
ncbi:hypothetical protein KNP414_00928 [Paenibacillus mucilaginosus KNP414]|uniref:Uncharacterized protein n=1 Tax=Paenibacillus mucilaginosus (strain KNP414) TaxID=1036673 RepID=F8F7N3_PAEMK|nr:hypothetical protein KNP414_00928 [Paenibacillus mucilaginosus KNP414]